jgi:proline iminopeptidase
MALVFAVLVSPYAASFGPCSVGALQSERSAAPRESRIAVGNADLYAREIGRGQPMIVLHGGPDFDHSYLVPDMDRLADAFRLIYYDQRGRGRSADGVQPADVGLASEIADLEKVREHFQVSPVALLGHSWGTVLALEYALQHPSRVSHLILMNPAPASRDDFLQFRKERLERLGGDLDRLKAVSATAAYKDGDPDAVAASYRSHFKGALKRPEDLEKVIASLRASFTQNGILKARAIEDRLMNETWLANGYDLLPRLASLRIPTLVIYSDYDFIPAATAAHITQAIPNARMVTLTDCGHFSYLECPAAVRKDIDDFFRTEMKTGRQIP